MSFAELKGICKSPSDHIEVGATVIVDGNQYEVTSKIGQYKGKKNNTRTIERSLTVKKSVDKENRKKGDIVDFCGEPAKITEIYVLPDNSTRTILRRLTKKELRELELK